MSLAHIDTLIAFALVMLLLSLLITTLVEACNSLLMRRGRNLRWGVAQVLERMGVGPQDAEKLADKVLKHPAISPSGRVPATAIRIEELARLVVDLLPKLKTAAKPKDKVQLVPTVEAKLENAARGVAAMTATQVAAHRKQDVAAVAGEIAELAKQAFQAGGAADSVEKLRVDISTKLQTRIDQVSADVADAASDLQTWFDMVMDRTTERFVSWTRSVTFVVAALFCLFFHVDSVRMLQRLSTDDELRGRLVAASGTVISQAEQAMTELDSSKLASESIEQVRAALLADERAERKQLAQALVNVPDDLRTPFRAHEWLRAQYADESARATVIALFDETFEKRLDEHLASVRKVGEEVRAKLADTQLVVLDLDQRPWRGYSRAKDGIDWKHIGGVAASILLLSLGAPFWFNTLRNLSNLRPVVARKIEKDQEQANNDATPTKT